MILIHGGRDHCRSRDAVALSLRAHFHVMAPDLRGHGDFDWAKGSSYSLSDYVYDVTRLLRAASVHQTAIVGHSVGGMIALMYAGAYPDHVSHLALLDGVTVVPGLPRKPIHQRIRIWSSDCFTEARRLALKTSCCSVRNSSSQKHRRFYAHKLHRRVTVASQHFDDPPAAHLPACLPSHGACLSYRAGRPDDLQRRFARFFQGEE